MKKQKTRDTRTSRWSVMVYPESAPNNWRDILNDLHFPWVESPLHDKDMNPTGELKKAHWHLLFVFETLKSYDQIKEITDSINSPIPQRVKSVPGIMRYFTHEDNPEKAQYSKSDIVAHGGADIYELSKISSSTRYALIKDMMDYVKSENITEMEDLLLYASTEHFEDWFPLLCDSCAYIMGTLIKSRRHRGIKNTSEIKKVNVETGEILN